MSRNDSIGVAIGVRMGRSQSEEVAARWWCAGRAAPLAWFALAATLALPLCASAQEAQAGQATGLQQAFQRFEAARAGNDPVAAVEAGRQALQSAAADAGVDARTRADLLRGLAEVLARSGNDAEALADYQQALELRGAELGADHPDLVPLLDAIADLHLRARRYPEAIATAAARTGHRAGRLQPATSRRGGHLPATAQRQLKRPATARKWNVSTCSWR